MVTIFQGNWNDLTARQYLELAGIRTRAYWIGNIGLDPLGNKIMRFPVDIAEGIFHVTQTRARTCNIESSAIWLSFIDSCYSLGCPNCGNDGWSH
jgi:5-carboxymethyl-2-hydroxymuconate isomerase